MKFTCAILLTVMMLQLHAQSGGTSIHFIPKYRQRPVLLEGPPAGKDSIRFHALKFYISAVTLYDHGRNVWAEPASYHLLDADEADHMRFRLSTPANIIFDELHFMLGIDSAVNAAGAGAGDLDATKGMYWAWQSGYINFKLEGSSSHCPGRKNMFFFHLGGFLGNDGCAQSIVLPVLKSGPVNIVMDLDSFIASQDLTQINNIMSPGEKAVTASKKLAGIFSIENVP